MAQAAIDNINQILVRLERLESFHPIEMAAAAAVPLPAPAGAAVAGGGAAGGSAAGFPMTDDELYAFLADSMLDDPRYDQENLPPGGGGRRRKTRKRRRRKRRKTRRKTK